MVEKNMAHMGEDTSSLVEAICPGSYPFAAGESSVQLK